MKSTAWHWNLASGLVAAMIVGIWAIINALQWVSPVFLPSPMATGLALFEGMRSGDLLQYSIATAERMALGWFLASLIGIVLGSLIGVFAPVRMLIQPTLEFIRPLPASALMPVSIALFGLSPSMVLAVIAFGATWPVLLATVQGFAAVEPRLKEVAQLVKLSRFEFIVKIGLPNAFPDVLAGMRLSLTVSLILAVVGEMLASQDGLGTAILLAARSYRSADLFAGVALLSLIGFASNTLLAYAERRLLPWKVG